MGLWGASDADESKPKYLTTAEKKQVFATTKGWVREPDNADQGNDNSAADPEVLVCIGDLTTSLGAATITSVEFVTTSIGAAAGGSISILIRWNEAVDVVEDGTGLKKYLTGSTTGALGKLRYASGTGTNELTFTSVAAIAGGALTATETITIDSGDPGLTYAGTTSVKDAGTSTTAEDVITSAQSTAAGSLTVAS